MGNDDGGRAAEIENLRVLIVGTLDSTHPPIHEKCNMHDEASVSRKISIEDIIRDLIAFLASERAAAYKEGFDDGHSYPKED